MPVQGFEIEDLKKLWTKRNSKYSCHYVQLPFGFLSSLLLLILSSSKAGDSLNFSSDGLIVVLTSCGKDPEEDTPDTLLPTIENDIR